MMFEIAKSKTPIKWTRLYETVAEENGVEWRNVDRAIRHAFVVCRCNKDTVDCVKKYIGYTNKSNSASLMSLYIRLKAEEEEK